MKRLTINGKRVTLSLSKKWAWVDGVRAEVVVRGGPDSPSCRRVLRSGGLIIKFDLHPGLPYVDDPAYAQCWLEGQMWDLHKDDPKAGPLLVPVLAYGHGWEIQPEVTFKEAVVSDAMRSRVRKAADILGLWDVCETNPGRNWDTIGRGKVVIYDYAL